MKYRRIKRYTLLIEWDDGKEEDVTTEVYLHKIERELDRLEEEKNEENEDERSE
jgi:hypothetical protein